MDADGHGQAEGERRLTRGEQQIREFRLLFRGFAISDVVLALTAFGIATWSLLVLEAERGRSVPPYKDAISQVLMLAMIFLFEAVYQVYLGIGYRISKKPARVQLFTRHKQIVAGVMVLWGIFGHFAAEGLKVALIVFVAANVVTAFVLIRTERADGKPSA